MSLARNVGKIVGKGMKVSYQSVDNVIDKAYTKVGQVAYDAGMKAKNAGMKAKNAASKTVTNEKIISGTKKTAGAVGKGFQKADQLVDKGLDAIGAGGSKAVNSAIGQKLKVKERLNPIVDKLDKEGNVVKTWDNLYTGKKLNPLYTTVGVGAVAAVTAAQVGVGKAMAPITSSLSNVEHGGPPEIMLYDGVGQQSAPSNLNANGSLVFGLHNQRKG